MDKCTLEADKFIQEHIYKNKLIIFGQDNCIYTKKAEEHLIENYKHIPNKIFLEKLENNSSLKFSKYNLIECLKKRTKTNLIPMIFLNGMFIGNFRNLEEKSFLKELDIFFY